MEPSNKFGLMLGLSIAETICCSPLFGIIGIVMAVLANNAYKAGNYEEYASKSKLCWIMLIVGLVISIIMSIIAFSTGMLSAFTDSYY